MRTRNSIAIPFFCGLLLIHAGCGGRSAPTDSFRSAQPLLQQGKEQQRANDEDGAIESYQQAIQIEANIPKAHLELGLLFDQHREDYNRAIYHYRRYIELEPEAEKRKLVEELIRFAEISFAEALPESPSEAIQEITRLKGMVTQLEEDLADSRKEISDLRVSLANKDALLAQASRRPAPAAAPAAPESTTVKPPTQRTYKVKSGDNLSRIASKVYKDSSKWRRIYDANRDTLKKPEDLSVGQTLVIPD